MTRQEAVAAVRQHGNTSAAAAALGISSQKLRRAMGLLTDTPRAERHAKPAAPAQSGKTLADFRAMHDKDYIVPTAIRTALRTMPGVWMYEIDFTRHAQLTQHDVANYRDQFTAHVVVAGRDGRKMWAKTKAVAEQMRRML